MKVLLHTTDVVTSTVIEILGKAKELSGVQEQFDFAPLDGDYIPPRGAVVLSLGTYKRRGMERIVQTYSVKQILSKGDALTRLAQAFELLARVPELDEFSYVVDERLEYLGKFSKRSPIVVDIETRGRVDAQIPSWEEIIAISLYNGAGPAVVIPEEAVQGSKDYIQEFLKSHRLVGHNLKFDGKYLGVYPTEDTMLLHYALEPAASDHGLKALAKQYFGAEDWDDGNKPYTRGKTYTEYTELEDGAYAQPMKYPAGSGYERIPRTMLYEYAGYDVYWTFWLYEAMRIELAHSEDAQRVYKHLMELSNIYQDIEKGGVRFDRAYMEQYREELQTEGKRLEEEFCAYMGYEVNPRSPKQVKSAFEALGHKLASTDSDTMEALAQKGERGAELLLALRKNNKTLGTYINGYLEQLIGDKGYQTYKLHASITGRLGGGGPSMLTIPRDKKVKRMVLPDEGHVMVGADASQMELRIMALESQDPWLIAAFQPEAGDFFDNIIKQAYPDIDPVAFKAEDIGAYTDLRAKIKGTIYGKSFNRGEKAIATALGISLAEAQKLSDAFVRPGGWTYKSVPNANPREGGWDSETRVRDEYIEPSEFSKWRDMIERKAVLGEPIVNKMCRRFQGEVITHRNRQSVINSAMSHISQSTGNDLLLNALKVVVTKVDQYGARVLGTIHDAIYVTSPPENAEQVGEMISQEIIAAGARMYGNQLQFVSDWGIGNNLAEV